ncbi:fibronectin type III domain-containing protein [Candidatus Peregrinibacteria bacterium]|nr:fibronectin type III domain-containing protein [Candidatus Peregrinibacteria bacterium]
MKRLIFSLLTPFIALTVGLTTLAFAQGGESTLELKPSVTQANAGDEFTVDVILKNPLQENIISVRAWFTYDPSALEGMNISFEGSPFTLAAPGEDIFSAAEGRVKIGRSNITGGMKEAEAKVASIRFRVKAQNPVTTVISPYDYQVTELGHVSVNIIDQGFPVNILSSAPGDIKLSLNPGAIATQVPLVQPEPEEASVDVGGSPFTLSRPVNLRVDTGSGYAELKWDMTKEEDRAGYFLYYGKTSGQYTRQRNVGDVGRYKLDGLLNGETYYFAVTAYDGQGRETDYSDEAGVIIGQPLSSTSPFEEMLAALLARIPEQPQNGPLVWWVLFSAFGLSGVVLFRTRKQV